MPLVRRPSKVIGKFRGNLIILQNEESTADMSKFEDDAARFLEFFKEALSYGTKPD